MLLVPASQPFFLPLTEHVSVLVLASPSGTNVAGDGKEDDNHVLGRDLVLLRESLGNEPPDRSKALATVNISGELFELGTKRRQPKVVLGYLIARAAQLWDKLVRLLPITRPSRCPTNP